MAVKRLLWAMLVCFMISSGLAVSAMVYANRAADSAREDAERAIRENERTNCIAYDIIHAQQQNTQPQTQAAKDFREAVDQIRTRFKCEEK